MYFQINQESRALYISSLNEKVETVKAKKGCLVTLFLLISFMMFSLTGILLLSSVEITAEILGSDFGEPMAALAVQAMIAAFAVSAATLIASIVWVIKASKKVNEAEQNVADVLRKKYGNAVYEEIKRQIISENTLVIVQNQWQKSRFCFLTADWLAYEKEFVRLDGIVCAFPFFDPNRAGGAGMGLMCLYLLLENGTFAELPLDCPGGLIHEIIQLLKQRMPAIYANTMQKAQTVTVDLEDGRSLPLPSDRNRLIELYKRRKDNLRRQSAIGHGN